MLPHTVHRIEIGGLLVVVGIAAAVVYVLLDDSERDPLPPFAMFALTSILGLCLIANAQPTSIDSNIDVLEEQMNAQHGRDHANRTWTIPDPRMERTPASTS